MRAMIQHCWKLSVSDYFPHQLEMEGTLDI